MYSSMYTNLLEVADSQKEFMVSVYVLAVRCITVYITAVEVHPVRNPQ